MFTNKDIEHRNIIIVQGQDRRKLKVENFQLAIYDSETQKCLTKIPFTKILCLFVIGDITLTSPLIERCNKNNVPVIVTKLSLRLVFFYGHTAEANFLLRQKQHQRLKEDLSIAQKIVANKIYNQKITLQRTRKKSPSFLNAIQLCEEALLNMPISLDLHTLLAIEGQVAKIFFETYYEDLNWKARMQRTKIDPLNTLMDIGYTILFNFIECFLRMFGFDLYIGVYHQLWFQRKSLVCDIVEPFRCLIDIEIRKNFNYKKFLVEDFSQVQGRYFLKSENSPKYYDVFVQALVDNKTEIFKYIQQYYRCFMGRKSVLEYPMFHLK